MLLYWCAAVWAVPHWSSRVVERSVGEVARMRPRHIRAILSRSPLPGLFDQPPSTHHSSAATQRFVWLVYITT